MTAADGFIQRFEPPRPGRIDGPLAGLTVAVKDNFDMAGNVTGAGLPEWADAHPAATQDAVLVAQLSNLGVTFVGKTHMDELAFSLMGQNARYGTPRNPAASSRMPGGSSSGSAVVVAAGMADIGLGSDTGGSVRLPASFCGLVGWRPTHGLLPTQGMLGLAPSYDAPGFMTRDLATMRRLAGYVAPSANVHLAGLRAPSDLWALADPVTAAVLRPGLDNADGDPLFDDLLAQTLLPTFRICQGAEVAALFGPWLATHKPAFGPGVADRFAAALALAPEAITTARAARQTLRTHVASALYPGGPVIVVPTAPGPAPLLTCGPAEMEHYRNRALSLLALAGHCGLPQVTLPVARVQDAPVGLSLIGPPGSDLTLLDTAHKFVPGC